MTDTEALCIECICKAALGDSSPQANIFVDARRHSKNNEMLIGEDGRCFNCGKSGLVVYYMMPGRREILDIKFIWAGSTSIVPRAELESKIRKDLDGNADLHPCHAGIMTAHLRSSASLERSVKGHLLCTCGKSLAIFSGDSDGSRLTWE